MTIITKRLILREFKKTDYKALLAILSDEKTNTFLPWFPLKTIDDVEKFYTKCIEFEWQRGGYYYAICLKEDNIPIGYINMNGDDSHDLGYALKSEYWHKGIMQEAAKAFILKLKIKKSTI